MLNCECLKQYVAVILQQLNNKSILFNMINNKLIDDNR